jgi:hypothetical protein
MIFQNIIKLFGIDMYSCLSYEQCIELYKNTNYKTIKEKQEGIVSIFISQKTNIGNTA